MGERKLYEDQIIRLIKGVPEEELPKIVSFVEGKIETRKKYTEEEKENFLKAIDEIQGKFRDLLPPSEEFMKRKQEEKLLDL